MMRILPLLPFLVLILGPFAALSEPLGPQRLVSETAKIYQASMSYIFKQQPLINQKGGDKAVLFGQQFINQVKKTYQAKFKQPMPAQNSRLYTLLLRAMVEVMEDNRTLINDKDIGFKGLIPATFAFQLSQAMENEGLGVKIKFTNVAHQVRNQMNQPDVWESGVMKKFQGVCNKNCLADYFEEVFISKDTPAYRYFVPVKLQRFCLNCHGEPQDNPLNIDKDRQQWTSVDITGFAMENWQDDDFAGGISVTIYKQDLLQLIGVMRMR